MKHKLKKGKKYQYRIAAVSLSAVLLFSGFYQGFQFFKLNAKADNLGANLTSEMAGFNLAGNRIRFNTYEDRIKEVEEAKSELEDKKKETEQRIAELEKDKQDILLYIEKLDAELNAITLEIEKLQGEIESTKAELDQTKIDLALAKEQEEMQYDTMKKRIQYMYENGSTNLMDTFLSSDNLVDFLNQIEYAKKISEYDNNLFKEYKETKELIANQEVLLTVQLDELNVLEEDASFQQSTLQQLVADKGREVEKYIASIESSEAMVLEYEEQIESTQMTIEEIREEERKANEEQERLAREEEERRRQEAANAAANAAAGITKTDETSSDKMIWPLPGDGRVYDGFGPRKAPTAGASTYHRGMDIGGETGASIVATLAGTVEKSTYSPTSGNYVIINHGNGLRTAYLHCSKLLVSAGDYVKQGEVVGLVGSTGVSTGPHLHFGVSINGVYVDPADYISYN